MKTLGYIGALLTCPCHAALVVLLLGGTAAGAWLTANMWLVLLALTVAFAFFLWLALRKGRRATSTAERSGTR